MARRSDCPIALTLDLLGDKWTLLILRDVLVFDRHMFSEFASAPEHIPTNLLAERLKRLVDAGLLEKEAYQENPPRFRYVATDKGRAVRPVIRALKQFGEANLGESAGSVVANG